MNKRRKQQIQQELQREIHEGIALQGFAIRHVLSDGKHPEYAYTVGLHKEGTLLPELFISGLRDQIRVAWLLDLGFRMQGPPPVETRQRIARAESVPVETLSFPPGGELFKPGVIYRDFADIGLPAFFGEVEQHYYESHFGQALVYHRHANFPILQFVWTDQLGHFPWEPNFQPQMRDKQQLLFDPRRYLPIQQEHSS